MDDENKTCKNCKYGKAHYMLNTTLRFVRLENEMHCCHGRVNKTKFKECFKRKKSCEYWEPYELERSENIRKIKGLLQLMYDRLDTTLQIPEDMQSEE